MAIFGAEDMRKEWFEIANAQRKDLCKSIGMLVKQKTPPEVFSEVSNPTGHLDLDWAVTLKKALLEDQRLLEYAKQKKKVEIQGVKTQTVNFTDDPVLVGATAFLVAPDIIATAAHVIYEEPQPGRPWKIIDNINEFAFMLDYWYSQPGHIEVPSAAIYQIEEVIFHTAIVNLGPAGLWRGLDDLAFLRLRKAPENRPILTISKVIPPVNSSVWSAGYCRCIPLKYKEGTRMQMFPEDKALTMSFAITNYPGDSGAPLLNEQNEVVGVISGTTRSDGNFDGFTVSENGWIIPVHRGISSGGIKETKSDLCVYAYRMDAARWLLDKTAKLIATFSFVSPNGAPEPPAAELTVTLGDYKATIKLEAGHEGDISVDCSVFIEKLPSGLLDLKSISFCLNAGKEYNNKVIQWLDGITLTVSPRTTTKPGFVVRVFQGNEEDVKNNQVYTHKPAMSLPDQRMVLKD